MKITEKTPLLPKPEISELEQDKITETLGNNLFHAGLMANPNPNIRNVSIEKRSTCNIL